MSISGGIVVAVISMALSVVAIGYTAYNTRFNIINTDINLNFQIWDRYEKYTKDLLDTSTEKILKFPGDIIKIESSVLNYLNFIENLCNIYNGNRTSHLIRHNIREIVKCAAIEISGSRELIQIVKESPENRVRYCEIRKFAKSNGIF